MKRIMILMTAMAISMLMAVSAHALEGTTTDGETISIDASGQIPGSDPLIFKPSPRVDMSYYTNMNGFAHNAVHQAAVETPGGMAYGMAGDTNKIYWDNASPEGYALEAVQTASSDALDPDGAGLQYNVMN